MARRKQIFCIVRVSFPVEAKHRDVLAAVRKAIFDDFYADSFGHYDLISVSPIPADRIIKPRCPPTKRERLPLIDIMEGKSDG